MSLNFITVDEAKQIIWQNTVPLAPQWVPLQSAAGLVSALDIVATVDIPSYTQSSMDGYAISLEGWKKYKTLQIDGESAAGNPGHTAMSPENAVRIFTGAPVPDGADTVVMQEHTTIENGVLHINDAQLATGMNVRPRGAEIKAGELALPNHTLLTPAAIGFVASIGNNSVHVFPAPRVALIITGNELQEPGAPLRHGQVYESNSYALKAALRQLDIHDISVFKADDTLPDLTEKLERALRESDIVLLTGGASVGDYDFVLQSAKDCGVTTIFHKIKQRPGKPMFFGKLNQKLVFGLPGNPASVITCFYEYVATALAQLSNKNFHLQRMFAPITRPFTKPAGLTHFLKGNYNGETVTALHAQESYRLSSFANANCLIQILAASTSVVEGELVEVHLLPN